MEMFSEGRTVGTSDLSRLKQACISSASEGEEDAAAAAAMADTAVDAVVDVDEGLEMRPPEALEMPWRAAKEPKWAVAADGVATMVWAFIFAVGLVLVERKRVDFYW